ncbi:hypothetical protein AGMMS50289_10360 [Betaproteobacteria bacterium]|nr:hypothetical protein AGMMS50289_10360 [Betaproteobacteria bacterium]
MNSIKNHGRGASQGFSIVELLIASALGLIILAGVFSVFLSNSQSFRFNSQMSRVQENGRFVMNMIEDDVRQAAYGGFFRTGLDGEERVDTMFDEAVLAMKCIDTADYSPVSTKSSQQTAENVVKGVTWDKTTRQLSVYGIGYVHNAGGMFFMKLHESGCDFMGTKTTAAQSDLWSKDKAIVPMPAISYYTFDEDTHNLLRFGYAGGAGDDSFVLTETIINNQTIVDNVDKFLVCAGVANVDAEGRMQEGITWDTTAGGLSASDDKWKRVTAIQVDLILASAERNAVTTENTVQSYKLCDGTTWTSPSDKRLHKLFHSTITLRNKVPNGFAREDSSRHCELTASNC